jgi:hypothetical protein
VRHISLRAHVLDAPNLETFFFAGADPAAAKYRWNQARAGEGKPCVRRVQALPAPLCFSNEEGDGAHHSSSVWAAARRAALSSALPMFSTFESSAGRAGCVSYDRRSSAQSCRGWRWKVRRNVSVNDNKRTDFVLGRRSQATFARAGFEGLLNLVSHCGVLGGLLLLLAEGDRAAGLYLAEQGRSRNTEAIDRVLDLPCCLRRVLR